MGSWGQYNSPPPFCFYHVNAITVKVDIFACINFRGFIKMDNFVCIKIRVISIIGSLGYYKSNFRGVHIFADI